MNRLFLLLFGMVTFVASAQVPDYVPTEGLVAWYPFNGNANDESGNGNDGEIVGAQLTDDRFGSSESAYSFEHTRIEIQNSAANDQFKTISFWFMSNSPAGNQVAFKQNVYVGHGYERVICSIQWNGTHFAGKEVCNAGWQYDNVGGDLNDGIWHHYVGILDSTQKRLYIDGTLLNEAEFNPGNMCSGGNLIIGQEWDGVPYDFIGDLDDFGFWNRALTEEEILALYNAPAPAPGCTDSTACNYNDEANEDDGTCTYPPFGLADCEAGGALCGEGTIWNASLQACVGFNDCPSDLDGDGIVGVNDLLSLLSDFGTVCPPEVAEWTCGDPVNYHGYDYATVQIGEQCWFVENLRTELYQNGDSIETASNIEDWVAGTNGKQVIYGNNIWECQNLGLAPFDVCDSDSSLNYFGRLYNWYAVDDERSLCPAGWHVPSDSAFSILETFLGMPEEELFILGWRGTNQGEQLKSSAADNYAWNGSNATGFSAVPAGTINSGFDTPSGGAGYDTVFWTSNYHTSSYAWYRTLNNTYHMVHRNAFYKHLGASVRCIKD